MYPLIYYAFLLSPCRAAEQGFQNAPCPAVRILWMASSINTDIKKPNYIALCFFLDH